MRPGYQGPAEDDAVKLCLLLALSTPALAYFALRLLGYPRLVGYDRSWSEWGNRDDLPFAR